MHEKAGEGADAINLIKRLCILSKNNGSFSKQVL
jgi:hypothetical protein